ncbi:MAG TPA: helix-turn-helix domain-containing protein [Kiritimatiellia bacterium]|nr:helix-turn-helix domain-containing protein [Kiritimatiellia bacterium]
MKKAKFIPLVERKVYQRLEDVIGCKWSTAVVAAIGEGVKRPGELQRYIPGISTKVLNERLRKLSAFGLIERREFDEKPLHVEYDLTEYGVKLAGLLDEVRKLNEDRRSE